VSIPDSAPAQTAAELDALVGRTVGLQPLRRVFHAGNGVAMALAPGALGLGKLETAWIYGAIFVTLAIGDAIRLHAPRLNILFFKTFPSLASPREATGVASSTWYALGIFLTWVLFPPALAVPAILVLALADPSASVVGRLVVRNPIVLAVAAIVALVEIVPWRVDDNLTIPLSAALLLSVLST
jgi:dolichol kinase